jgi:pyruvate/2-oxoglutarate dehydrogenase complex dihydrolipoamide acyltransferase (E2) component
MYWQVDGGDDGDAGIQQVAHILPAVLVPAARRIIERQAVDEANARAPPEDGRQVHALRAADLASGDHVQARKNRVGLRRAVLLHRADHYVLAIALAAAPAFIEHGERLADARTVPKEHLQPPTARADLLCLHLAE